MNAGIDYGMGRTNINPETGIRFGVISQHDVSQAWSDSSEADYGEPTCPKCGNAAIEFSTLEQDDDLNEEPFEHGRGCDDFACVPCKYIFDSSEAFGDEPNGFYVDDDEYKLTSCLDSDIMVISSPFYTFAEYCSPCVPGAGNLNSAAERDEASGVKAYCLGHDWFESGKAPYRMFRVDTGAEVFPDIPPAQS